MGGNRRCENRLAGAEWHIQCEARKGAVVGDLFWGWVRSLRWCVDHGQAEITGPGQQPPKGGVKNNCWTDRQCRVGAWSVEWGEGEKTHHHSTQRRERNRAVTNSSAQQTALGPNQVETE